MIKTEHITITRTTCSKCGKELRNENDFLLCRREHFLEYWWRNDPRLMQDLEYAMRLKREQRKKEQS